MTELFVLNMRKDQLELNRFVLSLLALNLLLSTVAIFMSKVNRFSFYKSSEDPFKWVKNKKPSSFRGLLAQTNDQPVPSQALR
ncbi:hypothetical protein MKX50_24185 [Paenibacillus sp. FSL W8-0186]|uniref:hypothetical protein n=1 Tax=Paenibacillus sp. FSL W8-0186 TaxID=2921709 RepID=UPI0030D61F26